MPPTPYSPPSEKLSSLLYALCMCFVEYSKRRAVSKSKSDIIPPRHRQSHCHAEPRSSGLLLGNELYCTIRWFPSEPSPTHPPPAAARCSVTLCDLPRQWSVTRTVRWCSGCKITRSHARFSVVVVAVVSTGDCDQLLAEARMGR